MIIGDSFALVVPFNFAMQQLYNHEYCMIEYIDEDFYIYGVMANLTLCHSGHSLGNHEQQLIQKLSRKSQPCVIG